MDLSPLVALPNAVNGLSVSQSLKHLTLQTPSAVVKEVPLPNAFKEYSGKEATEPKDMLHFVFRFVEGLRPEIVQMIKSHLIFWQAKPINEVLQYAKYCSDEIELKQKKLQEKAMVMQIKAAQNGVQGTLVQLIPQQEGTVMFQPQVREIQTNSDDEEEQAPETENEAIKYPLIEFFPMFTVKELHADLQGTVQDSVWDLTDKEIHASHTKKVACPQDHEEVLLRVPTTAKQVAAPEPEKEPREPEIEQELVEDGSITPVRDEGEELQKSAEESISTDTAGEPSTAEVLPEADGIEKQTKQVTDQEGERVKTDQSQSVPTPPEPVAGPSRENTIEKEKEKSPILRRILTEGLRKGDSWPESQVGKRMELVINETIEEDVDTKRKEELNEGELSGDRKLKRKRIASRRYTGTEWAYATTNEWQHKFMFFCFD
ncbi:hypothetical protein NDU88_009700 [Pleurodeles waltl]|uniref:Uncharacterized protein n=1 Tax=Pleurodeles waltl TaxID=8319 RepID=A0AAV7PSY0_PLEWA|nr:hypothetical protein NDU88_009700 [Pleurodeles waltl]